MNTNAFNWVNSGEYRTDIDSALTNIIKGAEHAKSEAETASVFEKEIYFLLRQRLGINLSIQKEKAVYGIIHSFSNRPKNGRIDSIVNELIIEYKHRSALKVNKDIEKAYAQVRNYLIALYKTTGKKYDALLTDGTKIAYFSFTGVEVCHTSLKAIAIEDIDTIIRAILNNNTKKFEPSNIVKDFAISSKYSSLSKNIALALFRDLTLNISDKTKMLFSEWKELMHLSVEDNGRSQDIDKRRKDLSNIFEVDVVDTETEYKSLFALQTTYAIIVKLIACKVIDKLNFNQETSHYHDLSRLDQDKLLRFFQKIEDGYAYASLGVRNFLEGDFFSWYVNPAEWNRNFSNLIKELIIGIDQYSAFSLDVTFNPVDIFKDLYMAIIPQSVRHSMGEYFTPEWLADRVVSQALNFCSNENWTSIDPCCGSGIFLMSLIKKVVGKKRLRELNVDEKKHLRNEILSRVYGIDINPLSVLSARVSYFIAIHKLGMVEDIEIPVYLGDSAIIPLSITIDGIECYTYTITNLKCQNFTVTLPKRFVERESFGKTMASLQAIVKTDNVTALYNIIVKELTEKEKTHAILSRVKNLAESLVFLHTNNWDGIWIRIVTNFLLIARLKKFDLIVGNPPWVKWEHLPSAYTKKIKEFCDINHIFCNDGGLYGGAQLNVCALISNVAASNWLSDKGILAFLMPDSLMSQNSYEQFRNFYLNGNKQSRLFLQYLDRWKSPLRPFRVGKRAVSQDFNTYYFGRAFVDYSVGVQVKSISRQKGISDEMLNQLTSFEEASSNLIFHDEKARVLSAKSTAFTYISSEFDFAPIIGPTSYLYRTGVESTPFEVFKMIGISLSPFENHYRFKNKVLKTSRYKVDDIPSVGWDLPTDLVYPMLEGPNVKPFEYNCGDNYHIIPYSSTETNNPISMELLSEKYLRLAEYFANHKNLLDKQSEKSKTMHQGDAFYALSKIGPYTFAPFIVAARDNSKFCAAVVKPTLTPWGEVKQTICVKHTIIISQDINKNFISEDEAHYINGILNSSIVVAYIHNTFKTNGFSLKKSNLFIPKYINSDPIFSEIASLSKQATIHPELRDKISKQITQIYLRICYKYNKTHKEHEQIEIPSISIAAEPFEIYRRDDMDKTVLIGCYRDKKHLEWILSNKIYNIRLGKRKGAMKTNPECFSKVDTLYLYDVNNTSKCIVFCIKGNKEMTGKALTELNYPRKSPGKSYMTFSLERMENDYIVPLEVNDILQSLPNHIKGTPIFLEPTY